MVDVVRLDLSSPRAASLQHDRPLERSFTELSDCSSQFWFRKSQTPNEG